MAQAVKVGERKLLQLNDFTGGLNTRVSRFLIKDNQVTEISNFFFGLGGVAKVRPGSTRKTSSSLGASGMLGGTRYYPASGSAQLVTDHGTSVYKSTDGGVTLTSILSGLSAFTQAHYTQTRDLLFRADGVNQPKKYNGTTVTRWGIDAPSSGLAAAAGAAGNVNGTVKYKVTFVTATAESGGNTTATSITVTNNIVNLSSIPVGGSDVTKRRIYRTKNGGAIFYLQQTIDNNVDTTATDNTLDSSLSTTEMPEDKDPPPSDLQFHELFKNRIFGVKASNLRQVLFGELFEPEAFPLDYAVTVPFPEGDKCTGLRARGDLLFVFGTSTIFVIVGDSPFTFTVRQTFADEGFVSQWGVIEVENVVMGPTRFGFQAFDGANARILSIEIEPTLRAEIDLTKLSSIAGAYDIENRVVRWAMPLKDGTRKEICFDLFRRAWTRTTRSIAFYVPFRGAPDSGELFTGDPSDGYIWQENTGTDDNGSNITARLRTKTFDFGAPRFKKALWHFYCDFKPAATGTLAISVDGDSGAIQEVFSPNVQGAGRDPYGTAEYNNGDFYGGVELDSFDEGYTYDPATSKDFVVRHADFTLEYVGKSDFQLYRMDTEFEQEQWIRKT